MSKNLRITVQFAGATLEGVAVGGVAYVAMRPVAEGIGLDWKAQYDKIKSDDVLGSVMVEIPMTGADGKRYKMTCLPEEYLQGWLFSVKPGKVKPELREKIIRYKRECHQVLHAAFTNGVAATNLRVEAISSKRAAGLLMADVTKDVLVRAGKTPKPYHFSNEHRMVNWALTGKFDGIEEESLTAAEAALLARLRIRNSSLLAQGLEYDARKAALSVLAESMRDNISRLAVLS